MNQFLQEQIAPPLKKSVKVKQIAAAIFLIIGLIIPHIWNASMTFFGVSYLSEHSVILCFQIIYISPLLLYTIGFIILSTIPLNRPTKLMIYTLIGIELVLFIFDFFNIFRTIQPSLSILINKYAYYISIILNMGILYAYSIIIKNNSIPQNNIKWVNILCIATIINLCRKLYFPFVRTWLMESFDSIYQNTKLDFGFSYIWLILGIVAYVKFCRCKAFDGNPDTNGSATVSYSPLNKYTASLFITTAVIIGTLIAYYKFIAPELMNLNI